MLRIPGIFAIAALVPAALAAHDMDGAFDHVPPRAEYYGHFLQGRVQHGAAVFGGGHLNAEALFRRTGEVFVAPGGAGFVVLVTPNLVNRASARATADHLAIAHCQSVPGATRVVYDKVQRHAPQRLESWLFEGRCR